MPKAIKSPRFARGSEFLSLRVKLMTGSVAGAVAGLTIATYYQPNAHELELQRQDNRAKIVNVEHKKLCKAGNQQACEKLRQAKQGL